MPIKYQCLSGGKSNCLIVQSEAGKKVTLVGDNYSNTIVADEYGNANFKNLKAGIYGVNIKLSEGRVYSKKIAIQNEYIENTKGFKQIKNLANREKIMLSTGRAFVLMNKNLQGHASNSFTAIQEKCYDIAWSHVETTPNLSVNLLGGNKHGPEYNYDENIFYALLQQYEKDKILPYTYWEQNKSAEYKWKVTSRFYLPSEHELATSPNSYSEKKGVWIGFTSESDRIKENVLGDPCLYDTRSMNGRNSVLSVNYTGQISVFGGLGAWYHMICCDFDGDAWVTKGSDGYWRIVDTKDIPLVKNLPLNSKIKLANGKTFVLQAKNVSGHVENSATFMSEFIIENAKWGTGIEKVSYSSSDLCETILNGYYNELSPTEKSCVRSYDSYGNFWLMSESEAGALNLSVQSNRVKKWKNGKTSDWFTRDYRGSVGEQMQDGEPQDGVIKYKRDSTQNITNVWTGGKFSPVEMYKGVEISYSNDPTWRAESGSYKECGVVPFFDLDGDTMCEKGSDGYWRIIG